MLLTLCYLFNKCSTQLDEIQFLIKFVDFIQGRMLDITFRF